MKNEAAINFVRRNRCQHSTVNSLFEDNGRWFLSFRWASGNLHFLVNFYEAFIRFIKCGIVEFLRCALYGSLLRHKAPKITEKVERLQNVYEDGMACVH